MVLTLRERNTIRDMTVGDPDFGRMGIAQGKNINQMITHDEIENVQGHVAAEANHTENKILQKQLDKIFQKFQLLLDHFDDQED